MIRLNTELSLVGFKKSCLNNESLVFKSLFSFFSCLFSLIIISNSSGKGIARKSTGVRGPACVLTKRDFEGDGNCGVVVVWFDTTMMAGSSVGVKWEFDVSRFRLAGFPVGW